MTDAVAAAGETGTNLKAYILPVEDIERVREAGGPLAQLADLEHVRDSMRVAVVEVDGRIVAYWCLFYALHAEPLEIHPDVRGHPGVGRALLGTLLADAQATGEPAIFSVIGDEAVAELATKLGFNEYAGRMFFLPLLKKE